MRGSLGPRDQCLLQLAIIGIQMDSKHQNEQATGSKDATAAPMSETIGGLSFEEILRKSQRVTGVMMVGSC